MKSYVLRTHKLTKQYGNAPAALQEASISLESGKIYGLIGQNGAGKTTLMRLVAGLSFPTGGTLELFGHTGERALQTERKRLGCMIEHPGYVPHMSARDNLRFYRLMRGIPGHEIEDELLELTGLGSTGKKKARDFSLGMKQRLGIAIALLGSPELLILDEPINGLDPLGVVEIRELLKRLCGQRQLTILISSHNLPELYQTATDYIFLHQGRIRESLTLEQLDENCRQYLRIGSDQPDKVAGILELQLHTTRYTVMPDHSIKLYDYVQDKEKVSRALHDNGVLVSEFSVQGDTLENYFLSLIGGDSHA
ncbi:ABC transporter ATP-binding protein [Paenibacillus sp. DMB5]|uniref:ABC transporter ATP-binding protein n=1 Tax=Paenibacillus sp. DMB5 TaxID=1780103 RepID=UPI00076D7922|nr:ABC transporter ATP-binding protein [Paenibacillus sp. DMB5]KUP25613.1 bacitracin ABC transporter ATP-binding protein [Paenibacillus sp. DMB5]